MWCELSELKISQKELKVCQAFALYNFSKIPERAPTDLIQACLAWHPRTSGKWNQWWQQHVRMLSWWGGHFSLCSCGLLSDISVGGRQSSDRKELRGDQSPSLSLLTTGSSCLPSLNSQGVHFPPIESSDIGIPILDVHFLPSESMPWESQRECIIWQDTWDFILRAVLCFRFMMTTTTSATSPASQLPAYTDHMGSLPPILSMPSPWVPSPGISLGFGIPPTPPLPDLLNQRDFENPYDKQTAWASLLQAGESESAHSLPTCIGES